MAKILTPEEVAALRSLAEKASDFGAIERRDDDNGLFNFIVYGGDGDVAWCGEDTNDNARTNAEYILAASPRTICSLIASHESLRTEVERLRALHTDERPLVSLMVCDAHWLHLPSGEVTAAQMDAALTVVKAARALLHAEHQPHRESVIDAWDALKAALSSLDQGKE